MAFLIFVCITAQLQAEPVSLAWDRNSEVNIAGYVVSYGSQSGTYTTSIDVGNVIATTVDLPAGQRSFVVVQAYNTSSQMSLRSAEIVADLGTTPAPSITALSPTSGLVGASVTISGANFGSAQGTSSIRFNGTVATPTSWSASSIVTTVPSGATTGSVVATVGGVPSNNSTFTVTLPGPGVTSLSPTSGAVGTAVTIDGANFGATQGTSSVRFNGSVATPTSWSAARIVANLPSGATSGPVVVTVNGIASNGATFTVTSPAPTVASLSPTSGAVGIAVTINGANFGATQGTSSVRFNGTVATPTSWSTARVVATVPSGATSGPVVVTVNGIASNGATFSVTSPAPSVANLSPTAGAVGVAVTINGANFGATRGASRVRFNGKLATSTSWSAARIVATVPGGATTGPVTVTVNGVASNGVTFTVSATALSVASLSPTAAAVGTAVTINGANFGAAQGTSSVRFNGTVATPTNWSASSIVAAVPGGATTGPVTVTVNGVASNGVTFTVSATAPSVASLSPTAGAVGTAVTISGANLGPTQGTSSLRFNGTVATPTTWSASSIVAAVPGGATTGPVTVTVNGVASNGVTFTVSAPVPNVAMLSPTAGAVGTAVTISGTNFGPTQGTSSVRFNGTVATPTSWSASSIVAAVPSGATTGHLTVTVNGVASSGFIFTVTTTSGLPAPWTSQDVGYPGLSGQATYASGTFSLSAAGIDIWDVNDQFRFVYQTLDGDGTIVARVTSLQNTDPWTKAGVMIREDLTSNAPHAMAVVTAGNGMIFQSRATRGSLSTSIKGFPGTAPRWIRVVRSGSSLSGSHSVDGTTWTLMGTTTVAMASRVYLGLALTSHNPSIRTAGTFSDVTAMGGVAPVQLMAGSQMSMASAAQTATPPELMRAGKPVVPSTPVNRLAAGDYDGDGRSDLAIYRPASGTWRVVESGTGRATDVATPWGTATDRPVPGDYDGDDVTDLAYYRPSTGVWSVLESSSNYTTRVDLLLGGAADVPVPGDYDGDGTTDVAVYSPITGQWWMLTSSTNFGAATAIEWSAAQGVPVPGDYDGDSRADPAIYQPSTGQWLILLSSTDYATNRTFVLGTSTDMPAPADFDGDGVTDPAVFQRSTGIWRAALSSTGFKTTVLAILGAATDVPVTADYDGDGKADLAVFRNGTWQILYSGAGYASGVRSSWGKESDVPLPAQR